MLENFWINPCDPVIYHWSKGSLLHVHILYPIYPYVESSGHNMQRSVVMWALFTFIPHHSQWLERIPTLIDVLIAFSVRHCSQFKVRNIVIPLIELLYSCDNQGHARQRGIGAIWTVTWYVYKNIVWKLPWRLIEERMYETAILVLFIVIASWPALSRLPVQWQKSDICHNICA